MRYTDVPSLAGVWPAHRRGHARACLIGAPGRPPSDLSAGVALRKLGGEQLDLLRKTGLAEPTLRATTLDGEVWEARFGYIVAKKPSDQHGIMYDTLVKTMLRADSVLRWRPSSDKVHRHCQQRRAAAAHAVERRTDLGAAGRARQRAQYRPAYHAGHRAPGHQLLPFDHARLRHRTGRTCGFRFSGLDLLAKAGGRPHGLPLDLPYRRQDAGKFHGLPRHDRSVVDRVSQGVRKRASGLALMPRSEAHDGRVQGHRAGQDPPRRPLHLQRLSAARLSCWPAMCPRPRARPPAPAPPKSSPTSDDFATSTSRSGLRPRAWARRRSRSSTTIPKSRPARHGA